VTELERELRPSRVMDALPRVVVVGAGFGGLEAARSLAGAPVNVTVVDRENHHLFQPLLYQVAMAGLSAQEIAAPTRSILSRQRNAAVLLADVTGVDLAEKRVDLDAGSIPYDYLIVAAGAQTSYFGHEEWATIAPGLKTAEDALEVRSRVLLAFELAEREFDPIRRRELLNFAVIGGGPTGVELAGALGELARNVLARDFRSIDPASAQIHLVEAGPRILPTFTEDLSTAALLALRRLGVKVLTMAKVVGVDEHGVDLAGGGRINSATTIWTAGVRPSPLASRLGVETDRAGRVKVARDLSIPGHPEAFVIGDMAAFEQDGAPLPGVSPVALQEGRAAAESIRRSLRGLPRREFRYRDKGMLATIGRSSAVAQLQHARLHGFVAWIVWLVVHIWYLIGFRNRVVVLVDWAWAYLTYQRGARVVTAPLPSPRARLQAAR
jgi:NADH dehydrogenase